MKYLITLFFPIILFAQTDTLTFQVPGPAGKLDTEVYRGQKPVHSLIVFLVGSKAGSTRANYASFSKYFFEDLLEDGYAVAVFDKRGVGKSEGKWTKANFRDRADDAGAVGAYLKKELGIQKAIVAGHSQGGWITQVALAEYPEVFEKGISLAGPTFSVKEQIINDYTSQYSCAGLEGAREKAEKKVGRILRMSRLMGWKGNLQQLRIIRKFEPSPYLKKIDRPLLLLFAENDALVNPQSCIKQLNEIFPEGIPTSIQYHVVAQSNHSFRISPLCPKERTKEYAEEAKLKVRSWLFER
jgi:pimeloyl-ACP methyl ester carboxylesterase